MGAVALDWDTPFSAFGLFFVEGRGDFHLILYGAAVAVKVICGVDAVWLCPGHFWRLRCFCFFRHFGGF